MADTVLKTENLKKVIGKRTIVSDISIELKKGEIFGFLGPNGAGKSTTIKMIVGLSKITEGDIYISGFSVKADFKKAMRNIGCIVENPDMYKYMTGLDNLKVFAEMYKDVDEDRINEIVKIVNLEAAIKDKVKTYSLGMKQRLGIAQALLQRPELLILDEPTAGLDPKGRDEILRLIKIFHRDYKMTIILVTHSMEDVAKVADRVMVMDHSKCILDGPIGMVFTKIDTLERVGLAVPQVTYLMKKLKEKGLNVREDIFTVEKAKEEIMNCIRGAGKC